MQEKQSYKLSIEEKRKVMIDAANKYGMNAEITVKLSQDLDKLLNQYHEKEKKVCC